MDKVSLWIQFGGLALTAVRKSWERLCISFGSIICLIWFSVLLYRCPENRWVPDNTEMVLRLYHIRFSWFSQNIIWILSMSMNLRFLIFILLPSDRVIIDSSVRVPLFVEKHRADLNCRTELEWRDISVDAQNICRRPIKQHHDLIRRWKLSRGVNQIWCPYIFESYCVYLDFNRS
jgi:hypothetical protein